MGLSRAASGSLAGSYVGVGGTDADVVGLDFDGRADTMNCSFNATLSSAIIPYCGRPAYDEFDDGIIESFILLIPCRFYHFEKMVDEMIIELC